MGNIRERQDTSLVDGFRRNDEKILREVYQRVFPKVRSHVLKNSGDENHARDIYQQAFIACWLNVKDNKFDGNGSLEAYLFTIAKNKWIDYLRSARFRKTVHQEVIQPIDPEEVETDTSETQEREILQQAIHQLGSDCKDLLILFYFERKNMQELAETLGIGAASARNKKYRCMEHLRALARKIRNNG